MNKCLPIINIVLVTTLEAPLMDVLHNSRPSILELFGRIRSSANLSININLSLFDTYGRANTYGRALTSAMDFDVAIPGIQFRVEYQNSTFQFKKEVCSMSLFHAASKIFYSQNLPKIERCTV